MEQNYDLVLLNSEIVKSLSDIYISMHFIDLEKDTFIGIKSPVHIAKLLEKPGTVAEKMQYAMQKLVDEEYKEQVCKFTDLTTIAERIGSVHTISIEYITVDGVWCRGSMIVAARNEQGLATRVIYAVEHIDERKQRELQLKMLSELDGLTNITNRGAGQRMITEILQSGKPGLFCILDVDKFKEFNDNYGHQIGDQVLIKVAEAMKKSLRGEDCCMRLGGDEFAFFAVGIEQEEIGEHLIRRLLKRIDEIKIDGIDEAIEVSIGAVLCPSVESCSFEHVYNRADKRLYANKRQQGNDFSLIWGDI